MRKILSLGAENKTAFSVMVNNSIYQGEEVDNLNDINNLTKYEQEVKQYLVENNIAPDCIACDMHPDYHSTRLAKDFARDNVGSSLIKVQHHFAHIVSCMLDNEIDEEVIGVSFDGTGYGTDGNAWGSEFLTCTRKNFTRQYHLKYVPQPGGDVAAKEPWRMALAYIFEAYGDSFSKVDMPIKERIGKDKVDIIEQMIEKGINSPLTSSMGRLFDAVSSMLGICDTISFEAEAAIKLESASAEGITEAYDYAIGEEDIDVSNMIREIVFDLGNGVDVSIISSKFHNTLGEIIFEVCSKLSTDAGINKVLISGGCFQNKYLVNYLDKKFEGSSLELYKHKKYSPTDLGISIGQAVIAANK